ncbi:MAG: glycosyltransferase [Thermoanaerobaculaceae bacterium]
MVGAALVPEASATPRVSIVIVTFNGRLHLARCIPAVLATTGEDAEIIVVDNASTDGTLSWLSSEYPRVGVVGLPRNLGFGEANRRGFLIARADFVVLLNNDTVVEPGWLDALLRPLQQDPNVAASCALLRLLDHPELLNANGGGMTWLGYGFDRDFGFPFPEPGDLPEFAETLFPTAAAALFRKADFFASGGFDPSFFMYHDDVDLGWRLWLLGKRVVTCRDAVVRHAWGGTATAAKGRRWRDLLGARHNIRALIKNLEPWHLARALKNIFKLWMRAGELAFALRVVVWNLAHLPSTLAMRRDIQRRRVRTDDDLVRRGLIADAPIPPPPPRIPVFSDPRVAAATWAPNRVLRPGGITQEERLGVGWYHPELHGGAVVAFTCGRASFCMRIEPHTSGRLKLTARLPPGAARGSVEVRVNGHEHKADLSSENWRTFAVPVAADSSGLIEVELRSATWIPHEFCHNWDFRRLGCAVKTVRFTPEALSPAAPPQTVSLVIPTFNRWECLSKTLEALAVQTFRPDEVIVVDDGSTDGTWERLEAWRERNLDRLAVTALIQANRGQGPARNLGVDHAHGDLVVFIGDDTFPASDFVEKHLLQHRAADELCAVVGFTDWDREGIRVTPFLEYVNRNGEQFAYGRFSDGDDLSFNCFYTSNVSVPRVCLIGEPPFHDAFTSYGWEDVELGYRLTNRGLRIIFCETARTRHHHPMSLRSFLRRQWKVGNSIATLYRLHPELEHHPELPQPNPPQWFSLSRGYMPFVIPILSFLDRAGIPLSRRIYGRAVVWAYYCGAAHKQVPRSSWGGPT